MAGTGPAKTSYLPPPSGTEARVGRRADERERNPPSCFVGGLRLRLIRPTNRGYAVCAHGLILERDQCDLGCPVLFVKRFPFPNDPNQIYNPRRPVPMRGGSRSSRTRGGMRWTLMCCGRTARDADGKVVWS